MPVILPFRPSVGNYRFSAVLASTEYLFDVRWNSRARAFYFDVREADETAIVLGIKAVLGVYYGRRANHPLFRQGALVARIPHGAARGEATFDDLGARVQVWYFTRDEVVEEIYSTLTSKATTTQATVTP
jgi:hypothetical protein